MNTYICKIPCAVNTITLEWIEIIPCTDVAKKQIMSGGKMYESINGKQ